VKNTEAANKLTIRVATVDDLDLVTELCAAHAAFEQVQYDPSGQKDRLALAITGYTPRLTIFLAETECAVVGYASATLEYSTWTAAEFLHMDCLYVDENLHGQGIGRDLFTAVRNFAIELGASEIQWQTPDWNAAAIGFYRSLGAKDRNKFRFSFSTSSDRQR